MTRRLLAAALVAGAAFAAPAATACTVDTCPYTQPLCKHGVDCERLADLVWCLTHHTCPNLPPIERYS